MVVGNNTNLYAYYYITDVTIDVSNRTRLDYFFYHFETLVNLTLLNVNSNVSQVDSMFQECRNIVSPPLFSTSNCTGFAQMFQACVKLENVPLYDVHNGLSFLSMFYNCSKIETIPAFVTTSATNFNTMFRGCTELKNVPVFDATNVTTMSNMFQNCRQLTGTSLNNIMAMCISTTSAYTGANTLQALGLCSSYYGSMVPLLPNYSAFLNA